jgi:hypothetical protein
MSNAAHASAVAPLIATAYRLHLDLGNPATVDPDVEVCSHTVTLSHPGTWGVRVTVTVRRARPAGLRLWQGDKTVDVIAVMMSLPRLVVS